MINEYEKKNVKLLFFIIKIKNYLFINYFLKQYLFFLIK